MCLVSCLFTTILNNNISPCNSPIFLFQILRRIYRYVFVMFYICNIISFTNLYEINIPGHFNWIHNTVANKDLFCPNCCMLSFSPSCIHTLFAVGPTALCCIRRARPFWTFSLKSFMTGSLEI